MLINSLLNFMLNLGMLMLIIVPVSTIFIIMKRPVKEIALPSVIGGIFGLLLIFVVSPNILVGGGFSDLVATISGMLLLIVSLLTYGCVRIWLRRKRK